MPPIVSFLSPVFASQTEIRLPSDATASVCAFGANAKATIVPGSTPHWQIYARFMADPVAYKERTAYVTEPTNPAQFFLRRARKLVDKNFIELVRELAPDSLDQVAKIMGVSTDEFSSGSSY